jgi:hypothetical protein
VPREPVTTATVPAPPPVVLGHLLLVTAAFVVLFVLPPCATSPTLDLTVLGLIGLRAVWALAHCLRGRQGATRRPLSRPLPSAAAHGDPNGV